MLNQDLGFKHGSPFIDGEEVQTIRKITDGGIFQNSGFKEGDILDDGLSIGEFYEKLEASRGQLIEIKIKRKEGDGFKKMTLSVEVPVVANPNAPGVGN